MYKISQKQILSKDSATVSLDKETHPAITCQVSMWDFQQEIWLGEFNANISPPCFHLQWSPGGDK